MIFLQHLSCNRKNRSARVDRIYYSQGLYRLIVAPVLGRENAHRILHRTRERLLAEPAAKAANGAIGDGYALYHRERTVSASTSI